MKRIMKTMAALALCGALCGCASMWEATDRLGVTQAVPLQVIGTRDVDTNGDGVIDAREITERVRHEIRPEIVAGAETVARNVAPGPWGEIAAAGVGLLSLVIGAASITTRKRLAKIENSGV